MTRLWIVILIVGWKLLDEIMVFRGHKNGIKYVFGKLQITTFDCPQTCGGYFSTLDSARN